MNWIFLGVMVGSIVYLVVIILAFIESFKESRAKIEQTEIDINRLSDQLDESEHARTEAENRTATLEEESLHLEHEITELHQRINSAMPSGQEASS